MSGRQKKRRMLFFADFDNLLISLQNVSPPQMSIENGFVKIISTLTTDIAGEIAAVFVFLPPERAFTWGKELHDLHFNLICCPKIRNKEGEDQDTVDAKLLELGEWLIENTDGITHVCLGSGDIDLAPLLVKARMKGLKRVIVAANIRSLAKGLIPLASKKPGGGRMVYFFAPTTDNGNQNIQ